MARDIYDIFSLLEHVDEGKLLKGLPRKLVTRGVDISGLDSARLSSRKEEFRSDWERSLMYLLPPGAERNFDEVWEEVIARVNLITHAMDRNRDRVPG